MLGEDVAASSLLLGGKNPETLSLQGRGMRKALRTAINAVFGAETPVQRCRNHKLRNVLGRLPREQQAQTASLMRAAWKMNQKDGMAKFRQIASWLEQDYPEAAAALLEGLEECFTSISSTFRARC